jgi:hypothetical protein
LATSKDKINDLIKLLSKLKKSEFNDDEDSYDEFKCVNLNMDYKKEYNELIEKNLVVGGVPTDYIFIKIIEKVKF